MSRAAKGLVGLDRNLDKFGGVSRRKAVGVGLEEYLLDRRVCDQLPKQFGTDLLLHLLQPVQTRSALLHGYLTGHADGRGILASRVGECVNLQKACFTNKVQSLFEILLGLTREAHDDVGGKLHARDALAQKLQRGHGLICVIFALHGCKRAGASALQGEMKMRGKRGKTCNLVHEFRTDQRGVKRAKAYATDTGQGIHRQKQVAKIALCKVLAPGGGLNACQHDLGTAVVTEHPYLLQNLVQRL